MELMIIYILIFYFTIGGIGVWFINRKKDPVTAREGWLKYFVYLGIVVAMLISMQWRAVYLILISSILFIAFFEILNVWMKSEKRKFSTVFFALSVFCFVASGFIFLAIESRSDFQMILYTVVLSFDGFSQISGQLFGRRQLVPLISPGKTIGGFTGGLLAALVTGYFLLQYRNTGSERPVLNPQIAIVLLSLLIAVSAFIGDLLASVYKRKTGVKDYSNLIPGHGGVLDRFDSFLAAGAVIGILKIIGILDIIAPTIFT